MYASVCSILSSAPFAKKAGQHGGGIRINRKHQMGGTRPAAQILPQFGAIPVPLRPCVAEKT
jgi:hypothetical protein